MNPLLKGYLIGAAIIVPLTLVLNVARASDAVVALTVTLSMSICVLIAVKIYAASKPR